MCAFGNGNVPLLTRLRNRAELQAYRANPVGRPFDEHLPTENERNERRPNHEGKDKSVRNEGETTPP